MKLFVEGTGDKEVGINPSSWLVEINGIELKGEDIEEWKRFLKEFDDNGTEVFTQEEMEDIMKQEEDRYEIEV